MSDVKPPYETSIAKIADQAELQRLYDACHELAEASEKELLPLRTQYYDLMTRVEKLEHTLRLSRSKELVIKEKLDATKALSTLVFRQWYQVSDDHTTFFYPQHKNAANRVTGIRVERCKRMSWEEYYYSHHVGKMEQYTGKETWRLCQTTISGADCEKMSRLSLMVLTGRNVETDLEIMRKQIDKKYWSTDFAIIDGTVVRLTRRDRLGKEV